MALTAIQRQVVKVLQPFRTEQSYVAGGAALNQDWPRLSDDMDIFHDQRNRLLTLTEPEIAALKDAGFTVEITVENSLVVEAIVRRNGNETQVQWFDDRETSKRFFPAYVDEELGFRLHQADVAVNKVLCASRRRAARDAVDVVKIVRNYAPLGPLVWAAVAKDNSSPPRMLQDLRSILLGFSEEELRTVRMEDGHETTRDEIREIIPQALDDAWAYCNEMAPEDYSGCLFVDDNECPIEANEDAVVSGLAVAMPIKDFPLVPIIGDGQPAID